MRAVAASSFLSRAAERDSSGRWAADNRNPTERARPGRVRGVITQILIVRPHIGSFASGLHTRTNNNIIMQRDF